TAERDAILAAFEAEQTRVLGADHPQTLTTRLIRALSSVVSLPAAEAMLADTCHRLAHTGLSVDASRCWSELGTMRSDLGDTAGARAALAEAIRFDAAHNRFIPEAMPYDRLWRGDSAAAVRGFTAALAATPVKPDEPPFVAFDRAILSLGLAR